jgi:nitroreductase
MSVALDEVLNSRRTVRAFSPEMPDREDVDRIIQAGLKAPYAAIAIGDKRDFRKFFIMASGTPVREKARDIIVDRFPAYVKECEKTAGSTPFVRMLSAGGQSMAASLLDKPCVVIAGERWGVPAIAPESLSFCLENMWLMATTLKIGFQLLSAVSGMKLGNDEEFCRLLGIKAGEYYLDGFALGYPAKGFKPAPVERPDFETSVKWL